MGPNAMEGMTNWQRALWTFLFYTLVGPFIGALLLSVLMPLALMAGVLPEIAHLEAAGEIAFIGWAALFTYVWAAPAAALTALGLLPLVLRNASFGWIAAAIAGVIAFAITAVVFTLPVPEAFPYLAFLAGVVSVICQMILNRIGVLETGPAH